MLVVGALLQYGDDDCGGGYHDVGDDGHRDDKHDHEHATADLVNDDVDDEYDDGDLDGRPCQLRSHDQHQYHQSNTLVIGFFSPSCFDCVCCNLQENGITC